MIGEALYALILSITAITDFIEDRVSWAVFEQAEIFPSLAINTQDEKPVPCRIPGGMKEGLLAIQMLANDEVELERLSNAIIDNLNGYDGDVAGYNFSIELNTGDYDEKVEDLTAFHKVLRFDYIATKLS